MSKLRATQLPELIAPAGDWDCIRAAVENGADAVYFGLECHNARMRAANFTIAELPRLMEFLHVRGVRGYVAFNTLIFPSEMEEAARWLRSIILAGADAAIVQDVGVCRLIRRISPDFPIHASTQMTITSAAGVQFAGEIGCNLVVLARECSISDIHRICEELGRAGSEAALPLEIFVHGALCVAYSGQCLTSESLGGRSANRGVCAQACRMPYELIADGREVPLGDRRYLLSPRDLAGLELLPELIRAGTASLKIEGRLKSPEYVANITGIYRKALDRIEEGIQAAEAVEDSQPRPGGSGEPVSADDVCASSEQVRYDMEMAFSRGLYTGWLTGTNNQELVHGRFGKKRGVFLGEVSRVRNNSVFLRLEAPLKPGDGVVFDAGRPDDQEQGGRVYRVDQTGGEARIEFGTGDVDLQQILSGDRVWKTSDPALDRRLRRTFSGAQPHFRRPVNAILRGSSGTPLYLELTERNGISVRVESECNLAAAEKQPLTLERLREHFGRLGGTPFSLRDLTSHLQGNLILPISELNRMRRGAVEKLRAMLSRPPKWKMAQSQDGFWTNASADTTLHRSPKPSLVVLVRNMSQLEAAIASWAGTVYCEFEDPKKYRDAVALFREKIGDACVDAPTAAEAAISPTIWVAPPRIFKPGEDWILRMVRSANADGYLVRNYDHLRFFAGCRMIGDYSLNIANSLSADYFIRHLRLERVTASYDLNVAQLEDLLRSAPPAWFEVTVHQHMPMFHMEHCIFCAFLSSGTDYRDCGRPCDTRTVHLRDRTGAEHAVKADAGCRNTVFNALAQTGAESVNALAALGVRHFRIEFLDESPELIGRTIGSYQRLLNREIAGSALWQELKLINQIGVTRGTLQSAALL